MSDQAEWVPLMEGVRIIARAASGKSGDNFTRDEESLAAGRLARAGREGRLRAEGVRYLDEHASPLKADDWMRLRIYEDDRLDDPHRNLRAFRVRITKVFVDACDVHRLTEGSTVEPQAPGLASAAEPATKNPIARSTRRGRKRTYDWPAVEEAFLRRVEDDGWPEDLTNEDGWRTQSDVERWALHQLDNKPSESIVRENVSEWLVRHRPANRRE